MAKVRAENKLTGRIAGVEFVEGEAVTENPGCLAFFRRKPGFEVETEQAPEPAKEAPKPRRRAAKKA